jgi:WD40 repeat protein
MLVTGGRDRMVRRWDLVTGAPSGEPLPHDDTVRVVAFHPSNAELLLTAGDDNNARLWNVRTDELVRRLPHGYPIWTATFSADGRTVLTAGKDGNTRVWDAATGQEGKRTLSHGGLVRAVAVSPGGRWAATASDDGTARLWAIRTGRPIGAPVRHESGATCALIDPADGWVVTAGEDSTARLQPAPTEFAGSTQQITLRAQVATGAELGPRGDIRSLDPAAWRQRRADLRTLETPAP